MHLFCYEAKVPSLELKTQPKQLLGSLILGIALSGANVKKNYGRNLQMFLINKSLSLRKFVPNIL